MHAATDEEVRTKNPVCRDAGDWGVGSFQTAGHGYEGRAEGNERRPDWREYSQVVAVISLGHACEGSLIVLHDHVCTMAIYARRWADVMSRLRGTR